MFLPCKFVQQCQNFVSNVGAYLSGASFGAQLYMEVPGLTHKYLAILKNIAREKHGKEKSFILVTTMVNVIKLFSFFTDDEAK